MLKSVVVPPPERASGHSVEGWHTGAFPYWGEACAEGSAAPRHGAASCCDHAPSAARPGPINRAPRLVTGCILFPLSQAAPARARARAPSGGVKRPSVPPLLSEHRGRRAAQDACSGEAAFCQRDLLNCCRSQGRASAAGGARPASPGKPTLQTQREQSAGLADLHRSCN